MEGGGEIFLPRYIHCHPFLYLIISKTPHRTLTYKLHWFIFTPCTRDESSAALRLPKELECRLSFIPFSSGFLLLRLLFSSSSGKQATTGIPNNKQLQCSTVMENYPSRILVDGQSIRNSRCLSLLQRDADGLINWGKTRLMSFKVKFQDLSLSLSSFPFLLVNRECEGQGGE